MWNRLDRLYHSKSIARISVAVIAVVWFGAQRPAWAEPADAAALFAEAVKLMEAKQVAQACDRFEASNHIDPRAGTLIALAQCREQIQQLASAWSAYKDALARVKDERKRTWAKQQVEDLEARLSYVTVVVGDRSKLEGLVVTRDGQALDPALWNQALPMDGGDHVVAGHAPGHDDWQATVHVPIEGGRIRVEVPRFKDLATPVAPPSPSPSPSPPPPSPPPPPAGPSGEPAAPARGMFTMRRKIAIGVGGASVIAVVAGAILGESSRTKQDDAFKLCTDPERPCRDAARANALIQSSHSRSQEANLAFGAGAAAAIAAGVLWFTGAPDAESRRVGVVPRILPGEAGLAVEGRF